MYPCSFTAELLTVQPHTPTPEPVTYDKTDGQWYTHDGVDVKDSQQRKGKWVLNVTMTYTSINHHCLTCQISVTKPISGGFAFVC